MKHARPSFVEEDYATENIHLLGIYTVANYNFFLLPQVRRWTIITYEHGINELPGELPNDLGVTILGN